MPCSPPLPSQATFGGKGAGKTELEGTATPTGTGKAGGRPHDKKGHSLRVNAQRQPETMAVWSRVVHSPPSSLMGNWVGGGYQLGLAEERATGLAWR